MVVEVYGKQDCQLCKSVSRKMGHFLAKWGLHESVKSSFMDMETEYGAAEGDFYEVFRIPSVLVKDQDERIMARWDGCAPPSKELRTTLSAELGRARAASPDQGRGEA